MTEEASGGATLTHPSLSGDQVAPIDPPPLHPGIEIRSYLFSPTQEQMRYGLFLPSRFNRAASSPLIIALHGARGTPESVLNALAPAAEGFNYIITAPTGYTSNAAYGFIRRSAGPTERENSRLGEIDVMNVLDIMRAEFNIDPTRTYIVGASIGAIGALHLASKYQELWAAVGAISPAIPADIPEAIRNYHAAPVIVAHGDQDDHVPVDHVRRWVACLRENKFPMQYHEYPGGTHRTVIQSVGENLFRFLGGYSRSIVATQ